MAGRKLTRWQRRLLDEIASRDLDEDYRRGVTHVLRRLFRAGAASRVDLLAVLQTGTERQREDATFAIRLLQVPGGSRALLGVVTDATQPETVRVLAAAELGLLLHRRRTMAPLLDILRGDGSPRLKEAVVGGMAHARFKGAWRTYRDLMADRRLPGDLRGIAALALGLTRAPGALGPLLAALRDRSSIVRHYAVAGLGELGDARALPHLEAARKRLRSRARRPGDTAEAIYLAVRTLMTGSAGEPCGGPVWVAPWESQERTEG